MNEITNTNTYTENFDMQTLMNLTGQNALMMKGLSQQMGIVTTTVDSMRSDMNIMKGDIDQLKYNEEITTDQVKSIVASAKHKVITLLEKYDKTYFRRFIGRLYTEAKKEGGLGSTIERTHKGDYPRVMNYIDAWYPQEGVKTFKEKIDKELGK